MMFVPLLIVFYQEADLSKGVKQLFLTATAVLLCVLGVAEYHSCLASELNEGRMASVAWLEMCIRDRHYADQFDRCFVL